MIVDLGGGRGWLEEKPAKSIARIDARLKHFLQITEAGRTWDEQNKHWVIYQRDGYPIALNPNTPSVHQKGFALDSNEAQRIVPVMEAHGWRRTVYRNGVLVEAWHFEYFENLDNYRSEPVKFSQNADGVWYIDRSQPAPASAGAVPFVPDTPTEEEDMLTLIVNGEHLVTLSPGVFGHITPGDNPTALRNIVRAEDDWQYIGFEQLPGLLRHHGCDLNIWDVRDGKFVVLNPLDGSVREGNVWTAVNALRAAFANKPQPTIDPTPIVEAARAGAYQGAVDGVANAGPQT
ncbi:hypothetical protein [Microbacterium sp. A1-JK]|uniref:hypothetical protein n=1 Tax=Microbacterium sp. A1-JK TaxID=3177516 RepID=UPI00388AEC0B